MLQTFNCNILRYISINRLSNEPVCSKNQEAIKMTYLVSKSNIQLWIGDGVFIQSIEDDRQLQVAN